MQDNILRFLEATRKWDETVQLVDPNYFKLSLPGEPKDCFLFRRACDLEDFHSEEDEKYYFSTIDNKVTALFDRFQTRRILAQFSPKFHSERIDYIIKCAWNYPQVAINKVTSEYEPFSGSSSSSFLFDDNYGGEPPVEKIYIKDAE